MSTKSYYAARDLNGDLHMFLGRPEFSGRGTWEIKQYSLGDKMKLPNSKMKNLLKGSCSKISYFEVCFKDSFENDLRECIS